ncbi:MAG: hypothetical protein IPK35_12540 [Saprospiraceae bacterium]|jgi:hypothetical protein|nr:hypothetical protein [Saprospiraceae bacterium]
MAFFRGMDPTTGRWMQVDPKAEIDYFGSPYRYAISLIFVESPKVMMR